MTRAIEIEFPRALVLENVAAMPLTSLEGTEVQKTALALNRFIRGSGGSPVGPLIQVIENTAAEPPRTRLMRQSTTLLPAGGGASVHPRIEVRGCVLAAFRGDAAHIDIVYSRLSVYAYEQDLVLDGTVYLVFVGEDGMEVAVDAFASVETVGRRARR
jgi:hypothetical protein